MVHRINSETYLKYLYTGITTWRRRKKVKKTERNGREKETRKLE